MQGRETVFPTRQSLGLMKVKLKGAETGHSLLKRKSEALTKSVSSNAFLSNRACLINYTIPLTDTPMRWTINS